MVGLEVTAAVIKSHSTMLQRVILVTYIHRRL